MANGWDDDELPWFAQDEAFEAMGEFVSWLPFIILIGFWVYFMKYMKAAEYGKLASRQMEHMQRVESLLERIATVLEKEPVR